MGISSRHFDVFWRVLLRAAETIARFERAVARANRRPVLQRQINARDLAPLPAGQAETSNPGQWLRLIRRGFD
jgi:hypothetical protein